MVVFRIISFVVLTCLVKYGLGQNNYPAIALRLDAEAESYLYFKDEKSLGQLCSEWKSNFTTSYLLDRNYQFKSNIQFNYGEAKNRRFLSFRELYGTYRNKRLLITLGRQILDWGQLPGWSPSDLPNSFRYFDFLDTKDEEQGLWAGTLNYHGSRLSLKFMGSPFLKVSRLYLLDNRWINLPTQTSSADGSGIIPLRFKGHVSVFPTDNYQFSSSITLHFGNLDASLQYYNGINDIPLRKVISGDLNEGSLDFKLMLIYHRLRILSLKANTFIGEWSTWGEVAYTRSSYLDPKNNVSPIPYYTITGGVDKIIQFENAEKELVLMLQYFLSFNTRGIEYRSDDLDHIFNNAIISRIKYRLNYKVHLELNLAAEIAKNGVYLNPVFTYRLDDNLSLSSSLDLLTGKEDGFFGYYRNNSRARLAIKYFFIKA